jgi:hypothetical protein
MVFREDLRECGIIGQSIGHQFTCSASSLPRLTAKSKRNFGLGPARTAIAQLSRRPFPRFLERNHLSLETQDLSATCISF